MAEKILKSLILVESTAKARTLRKFVGRLYSVMSTDGFLKNLPKSRIGVSDDYQPEYITVRGRGKLLNELKRETLKARRVFFATNPDAQGEFLARQYCELFGVNPDSHCRLRLNELTKDAFKASLEDAQPINDNLADSFQAKQLIDKYVSHKVGEYLSRAIWRGVKVGRFRAMLLRLISKPLTPNPYSLIPKLTPATLQELALKELNYSAARTRIIVDQLYEGINFESDGYAGLIAYPHGKTITLTNERRKPEDVKEYLTEQQLKIYSLIHSHIETPAQIKLDGSDDAALMTTFDALGVDWAEVYAIGIASLIKRKYIVAEDSTYKVTALGQRVLDALNGFFDDVFSADSYNEVSAQVVEIAAGKAKKLQVIASYCDKFNTAFNEAMASLGEDAKPQNEPVIETEEICEKCGRTMLIRHGRYGTFLACSGYPDCKNTKPLLEPLKQTCPKCGGHLAKRSLNRGRTFYCCDTCDFSTWDEPQMMNCKACGSTMFAHRFKGRAAMFYCGNEKCSTREKHPINKILEDVKHRAEVRRERKALKSEAQS